MPESIPLDHVYTVEFIGQTVIIDTDPSTTAGGFYLPGWHPAAATLADALRAALAAAERT